MTCHRMVSMVSITTRTTLFATTGMRTIMESAAAIEDKVTLAALEAHRIWMEETIIEVNHRGQSPLANDGTKVHPYLFL